MLCVIGLEAWLHTRDWRQTAEGSEPSSHKVRRVEAFICITNSVECVMQGGGLAFVRKNFGHGTSVSKQDLRLFSIHVTLYHVTLVLYFRIQREFDSQPSLIFL